MDVFLKKGDCFIPLLKESFVSSQCYLFEVCGTHVNNVNVHEYTSASFKLWDLEVLDPFLFATLLLLNVRTLACLL